MVVEVEAVSMAVEVATADTGKDTLFSSPAASLKGGALS